MKPTDPPNLHQATYQLLCTAALLLLAIGLPYLLNAFALKEQVFGKTIHSELGQLFFFNYVFGAAFVLSGLAIAMTSLFYRKA